MNRFDNRKALEFARFALTDSLNMQRRLREDCQVLRDQVVSLGGVPAR